VSRVGFMADLLAWVGALWCGQARMLRRLRAPPAVEIA
jgi:hypothetical protein